MDKEVGPATHCIQVCPFVCHKVIYGLDAAWAIVGGDGSASVLSVPGKSNVVQAACAQRFAKAERKEKKIKKVQISPRGSHAYNRMQTYLYSTLYSPFPVRLPLSLPRARRSLSRSSARSLARSHIHRTLDLFSIRDL